MIVQLSDIASVFNGLRTSRYNRDNLVSQRIVSRIHSDCHYDVRLEDLSSDINGKYYTRCGDILIHLHDASNMIKINEEGLIIPMSFAIVRVKPEYNADYVYYALKNILPREIAKLTQGSVLRTINLKLLRKINIDLVDSEKQVETVRILNLIEEKRMLETELLILEGKMQKGIFRKMVND